MSKDTLNYGKPDQPRDWKKWQAEKKVLKRKWREERQIKELEKDKARNEAKVTKVTEVEPQVKGQGRDYTVTIALPGSILDNAQSPELRTYLAGQIARAAVVFNVDEIVIFDESGTAARTEGGLVGMLNNGNVQLARILQYLECPQYLRKAFFPQHKDLQYAGLLNPLDCPHHMKQQDDVRYREGIILQKPAKPGQGSYADVGFFKEVQIDKQLQAGLRVTVEIYTTGKKKMKGRVVAPSAPRTEEGTYWGYSVRLAASLGGVFTGCPYKEGYDLTIGTSDNGLSVDELEMSNFKHMLVVFGGLSGLEASLDSDPDLHIDEPELLFTHYVNTCPDQGSNIIRTEEAILISLAALRPKLTAAQAQPAPS